MHAFSRNGGAPPDLDDPARLRNFYAAIQQANGQGLLLAYHDRTDGGAIVALIEMAFAGHCGLDVQLEDWAGNRLTVLFNEELGALVQVRTSDHAAFQAILATAFCRRYRARRRRTAVRAFA